jgi:hypothetical protein
MNVIKDYFLRAVPLKLKVFLVLPYPTVPEVGTEKLGSVGAFCPLVSGNLTSSFDTHL